MSIKDYMEILKFAIELQIEYQKEEIQEPYADESFHNGVMVGLKIALEKIEASKFLAEKY